MTPEEEALVRQIESTVRDSKIVPSGVNVQGGFPDLPQAITPIERLQNILKAHQDFKIVGGDNVTVEGSLRKGYAICSTCPEPEADGFPNPVPPPPIPALGACCVDGECSITTEADCEGDYQGNGTNCDTTGACCIDGECSITTEDCCTAASGTYKGDDTTCEFGTCIGACCFDDGTCDVESQSDCSDNGGTYQGDGTNCDINPCKVCCGFINPADGHYYYRKDVHLTGTAACEMPLHLNCDSTEDITSTGIYDPDTCELTVFCSGSGDCSGDPFACASTHEDWVTHAYAGGCGFDSITNDPLYMLRSCMTISGVTCSSGSGGLLDVSVDCTQTDSEPLDGCSATWSVTVTYSEQCNVPV